MSSYLVLTREEMVEVSRKWVTPPGYDPNGQLMMTDRPLVESIPVAAALLPMLIDAHNALVTYQPEPESVSPEVLSIRKSQTELDLRHDDLIRGLFGSLSSLAILVGPGALREKLIALRDKLFPDGLAGTRASYTQEAGAVQILEGSLTDTDRGMLQGMMLIVPGAFASNLMTFVQELIAKGKELGTLEDRKNKLLEQEAPSRPTETALMRQWNQVVTLFENNLKLAKLSPEVMTTLLGPLHIAFTKALERQRLEEKEKAKAQNPT